MAYIGNIDWDGVGSPYGLYTWSNGAALESLAPGDTPTIHSGTINISSGNLDGDQLVLGNGGIGTNPPKVTVNLSGTADLDIAPSDQEGYPAIWTTFQMATINVSGSHATLTVGLFVNQTYTQDNAAASTSDFFVNLGNNAALALNTCNMYFGKLSLTGNGSTSVRLEGLSTFNNTQVTLDTSVIGNGTMLLDENASLTINGSVSAGSTYYLNGAGTAPDCATLIIDKPASFKGSIDMPEGESLIVNGKMETFGGVVELAGLNANKYSLKGDVLSLFNGNKLVDTVNFTGAQLTFGAGQYTIQHNARGILIATEREDAFQPGGIGTSLSLHG